MEALAWARGVIDRFCMYSVWDILYRNSVHCCYCYFIMGVRVVGAAIKIK